MTTTEDQTWVPQACILPTAERPLRLAEFDDLVTAALRGQRRLTATTLRWELDPAAEATARDLAGRESNCCSFFSFTFSSGNGLLGLVIEVPAAHVAILDALAARAATMTGRPEHRGPVFHLRTGRVAAAAGVNLQTLRYYERRGLIAEPGRSLGGHRLYPSETVTVLKVIKAAQRLGFSLDEIAGLLTPGNHRHDRSDARARPDAGLHLQVEPHPDESLRHRAQEKLAEVETKIADLQVIASTLRAAVAAGCDDLAACAEQPDCPIPFAASAR
ncbi:hypothetical protein GCM10010435_82310 [Winogradskya consettensis]|uniref:HTH merR-type domain-containing protein n=1 Tax=Winogradskya consettensis TaxID=113560 RepID=A0A919SXD6_9ACTN|nr:MerR family transcriptional regulator [Actinoplanes consettensis]GIM79112.1 hypothetical protein Aco04nite_63890 [Actinoplanes consettensis]